MLKYTLHICELIKETMAYRGIGSLKFSNIKKCETIVRKYVYGKKGFGKEKTFGKL